MSNFISRGIKGARRALHLPPITLKNVATKYGPAALTVASLGGAGPLAGIAAKVGSAASAIPGASKAAGIYGAGKRLLSGGGGVPQVTKGGVPISMSDINPNIPPEPGGGDGGGGDTGLLGSLMNYGKSHIGDIAMGGLAALDATNAARASKRQGQLSDEALQLARSRYQAAAPLREQGMAGLLKPKAPVDFNAVYGDPTNPFGAPVPRPALPAPGMRRLLPSGG